MFPPYSSKMGTRAGPGCFCPCTRSQTNTRTTPGRPPRARAGPSKTASESLRHPWPRCSREAPGGSRGHPRPRSSREAEFRLLGLMGAQEGLQTAQDGLLTAQDGGTATAQDGPKSRPRRPQAAPRIPSRKPPKSQNCENLKIFARVQHSRRFGLNSVHDGPRAPRDRPRTAQEALKRTSREPKTAPRLPKRPPRRAQEAPRTAQKHPKRAPRRPTMASKTASEGV